MPMYNARTIANYFINRGIRDGNPFTPLQIQKLVYFCHAWMLAFDGNPMIRDDQRILAWKNGPVISDLYYDLKKWGRSPVRSPIEGDRAGQVGNDAKWIIEKIYDDYGRYPGSILWDLTHAKGTPWDIVWNERDGKKLWDRKEPSAEIPNDMIERYYRELLDESRSADA